MRRLEPDVKLVFSRLGTSMGLEEQFRAVFVKALYLGAADGCSGPGRLHVLRAESRLLATGSDIHDVHRPGQDG